MKPLQVLGDSLKRLRGFPEDARRDACYQLEKVQRGDQPDDFKPMPAIGKGAEELRIWDESGTYRVIYTARLKDCVAVLHAFQKKTQTTSPRDIEWARTRWFALSKERQTKTAKSSTSKKHAPLVESFASVWDALADTPEQAAKLRACSDLMRQITASVKESNWTQTEAAQRCGVAQPRINDLLRGRVSRFSLDALVNIATAMGRKVHFELQAA